MFSRFRVFFHGLLHKPLRVFWLGLSITLVALTLDGSLWRFWTLRKGEEEMKKRIMVLEQKLHQLEFKIHQAKNLNYIERQATDQLDYVREGDLIFVFGDQ